MWQTASTGAPSTGEDRVRRTVIRRPDTVSTIAPLSVSRGMRASASSSSVAPCHASSLR